LFLRRTTLVTTSRRQPVADTSASAFISCTGCPAPVGHIAIATYCLPLRHGQAFPIGMSPSNVPLPLVSSEPSPNTRFRWPPSVHHSIDILISSVVFAGHTVVTNRQTRIQTALHIGTTWRIQLIERSVRGGDAAMCQITLTSCYVRDWSYGSRNE